MKPFLNTRWLTSRIFRLPQEMTYARVITQAVDDLLQTHTNRYNGLPDFLSC